MEKNQVSDKVQQMFGLIESWQQSGIDQKSFCKAQGIAYGTFHYWFKRYRQRTLGQSNEAGFKKIEITGQLESDSSGAWLVVRCADGRQFIFNQALPADLLLQLMR